jgi:hypothetical protein
MNTRYLIALSVVVLLMPGANALGLRACPLLDRTLRDDLEQCDVVLWGHMQNAQKLAKGGTTEFVILSAVKMHPFVADQRILCLPHYVPADDPTEPHTFLIFGDCTQKKVDFFRGIPAGRKLVNYVRGLQALDKSQPFNVLRYCYDSLEDPDATIADDAHAEFAKARREDVAALARTLSPEQLRGWLMDPKVLASRLALYAFLLGHCGSAADSALLLIHIDRLLAGAPNQALEGLLLGYVLLKPREGWDYLCALRKKNAFLTLYAVLQATRYLHDHRPDVVKEEQIEAALEPLLNTELADLVVNDFRRWRCWHLSERILSVDVAALGDFPCLRTSILRYALQCPREAAKNYVAERRLEDPRRVADNEELLRLEAGR